MTDPATPSWTGGQYSLCRAIFGLALAGWFGFTAIHAVALAQAGMHPRGPAAVAMAGLLAAVLLAAGAFDRLAAGAMLLAAGLLVAWGLMTPGPGGLLLAGLLVLHALQPPAPYLSLAAIGRIDPDGGWRPRPFWPAAVFWLFAAAQAAAVIGQDGRPALRFAPVLFAAAGAMRPRLRGVAFAAIAFAHGVGLAQGGGGSDAAFLVGLVFAIDPRWFGGAARTAGPGAGTDAAPARDVVFYDGDCGLCHRAVRFLVAEDRAGACFVYAPLGGGEAARRLGPAGARDLPDSIVLLRGDGAGPPRVRSAAVLHALDRLGGLWRALAFAARAVPRPIGDAIYDAVARARRQVFTAPRGVCPVLPPAMRARFILDEPDAG